MRNSRNTVIDENNVNDFGFEALYKGDIPTAAQFEMAINLLRYIAVNKNPIIEPTNLGYAVEMFADFDIEQACTFWNKLKDNLEHFQRFNVFRNSELITNKRTQDMLWFIRDHKNDIRALFYYFLSWYNNADEAATDRYYTPAESTLTIFMLINAIWVNSVHGWFMRPAPSIECEVNHE